MEWTNCQKWDEKHNNRNRKLAQKSIKYRYYQSTLIEWWSSGMGVCATVIVLVFFWPKIRHLLFVQQTFSVVPITSRRQFIQTALAEMRIIQSWSMRIPQSNSSSPIPFTPLFLLVLIIYFFFCYNGQFLRQTLVYLQLEQTAKHRWSNWALNIKRDFNGKTLLRIYSCDEVCLVSTVYCSILLSGQAGADRLKAYRHTKKNLKEVLFYLLKHENIYVIDTRMGKIAAVASVASLVHRPQNKKKN